jgi:hypothetical protein
MTTKVKGIVLSVVLVVIALLLIPLVTGSAESVITDTITDSYPAQVVAGTEATVTLTQSLYLGLSPGMVTGLTADGVGAVPVASTYTEAGPRTLLITGLGADTPQAITVTYKYEVNDDYDGVNDITALIPLLVVVGLFIVAIFNGMWALKQGD